MHLRCDLAVEPLLSESPNHFRSVRSLTRRHGLFQPPSGCLPERVLPEALDSAA